VNYYRCDPCGHVWAHVHAIKGMPMRDVTVDRDEFLNGLNDDRETD
jgi:hypothetical protein